MIRISSTLAMSIFDSYKRNNNLTTHQPLSGTNIIGKFWTKSLVFTYEGNDIYCVDTKNKAENRSALPLFEEWANTNHRGEVL
jgi:hypothetical protein